jgi:hypothetical protein
MKIKGLIDVYIRDQETGVVVDHIHTENTFTNVGRQHVVDWLLHDNYSEDAPTLASLKDGGGKSLSNIKQIPYDQITAYNLTGDSTSGGVDLHRMLHPHSAYDDERVDILSTLGGTDFSAKDYQYGTIYFEFSEPKDLTGLAWITHRAHAVYGPQVEWSTSPNDFATNTDWTPIHYERFGYWWTDSQNNQVNKRWFVDHADKPDQDIARLKNVKTLRMALKHHGSNQWGYIYGIWFYEANFYPNTPSVLALGTSNTASAVTDTALVNEHNRGWIKQVVNPSSLQVTYRRRLAMSEYNDTTFREIGLFVHPTANAAHGADVGPDAITSLFARGVFDTPWSKTSSQVADIEYTLTLA